MQSKEGEYNTFKIISNKLGKICIHLTILFNQFLDVGLSPGADLRNRGENRGVSQ